MKVPMIDWTFIREFWPDIENYALWSRIHFTRNVFLFLMGMSVVNLAVALWNKKSRVRSSFISLVLSVSVYFVFVSNLYALTYQTHNFHGLSVGPLYALADMIAAFFAIGYIFETLLSWIRRIKKRSINI